MNELIAEYSKRIQDIVKNGTIGDYTFDGILYEFARDTLRVTEENAAWDEYERRKALDV